MAEGSDASATTEGGSDLVHESYLWVSLWSICHWENRMLEYMGLWPDPAGSSYVPIKGCSWQAIIRRYFDLWSSHVRNWTAGVDLTVQPESRLIEEQLSNGRYHLQMTLLPCLDWASDYYPPPPPQSNILHKNENWVNDLMHLFTVPHSLTSIKWKGEAEFVVMCW